MEKRLSGVNFHWVRDCFELLFQQARDEGEAMGGRYAFKSEFLILVRPFIANPSMETAIPILKAEPALWEPFEQSKMFPLTEGGDETHSAQDEIGRAKKVVLPQTPAGLPSPHHQNPALRRPAAVPSPAIQNARQMPVIEAGVAAIRLGIFTLLCRKFERSGEPEWAGALAFCVTTRLFSASIEQRDMKAFAEENEALIEREASLAFADKELSEPLLMAYAALMIALGWETGSPLNPTATALVETASANGAEIPNIVRMWGIEAIGLFFRKAQEFMVSCFSR